MKRKIVILFAVLFVVLRGGLQGQNRERVAMALPAWSQANIGFHTRVGQKMPDFKVSMLAGRVVNTKELRGKVILLDFWGAKCGGCLLAMKRFPDEILKPYAERKDFFLLPVEAQKHTVEEIQSVANRLGFRFPLAYENGEDLAGLFFNRAMGLPRTLIINRKGKIVYQAFGYSEKEFTQMLKILKKTLK